MRFEFSPLGKAFSTELDKTAQGYQEEGVMKLLKDIRDGLAGGIRPPRPGPGGLDRPDDNDDDNMIIMMIMMIIMMIMMMIIMTINKKSKR